MTDLAEFLLARIAEDEASARHFAAEGVVYATPGGAWGDQAWESYRDFDADRVLAECDAKRQIVERIKHYQKFHISDDFSGEDLCDDVLSLLASVYASHPDWREEWKP